jgi:hypothetical protein
VRVWFPRVLPGVAANSCSLCAVTDRSSPSARLEMSSRCSSCVCSFALPLLVSCCVCSSSFPCDIQRRAPRREVTGRSKRRSRFVFGVTASHPLESVRRFLYFCDVLSGDQCCSYCPCRPVRSPSPPMHPPLPGHPEGLCARAVRALFFLVLSRLVVPCAPLLAMLAPVLCGDQCCP